jgi:hypothetical protein
VRQAIHGGTLPHAESIDRLPSTPRDANETKMVHASAARWLLFVSIQDHGGTFGTVPAAPFTM